MTYLIGVDAGTSNCKATLIDSRGHVIAGAQATYVTDHPRARWAEQDPQDWYWALVQAIRKCLHHTNVSPNDILALSVCGPAHNAVLLDREGGVLQPVILWSDLRSVPQAEWLEAEYGSLIYKTTYQPPNPSWTLSQLLWVRQNRPEIWRRIDRIVIGKDYLSFLLTGAWSTDWYDAMGTQLLDARSMAWSEPICEILGLAPVCLPPVNDATAITGRVSSAAARDAGLAPGTPVAVGSGDSVVEALGAGVVEPGQCIVKLGTAGNVNVVTSEPRPDRGALTYRHVMPGRWFTITATNSGAASARWFRDAFHLHALLLDSEEFLAMDRLAAEIKPGSEGLIFHPYLHGERVPYWDPELRAGFLGITARHQLGHFARAVLEGVAFSLRDCMAFVHELGISVHEIHLMGGGARSALWRQILADVLGAEMLVHTPETTSYGAALLAGIAGGVFADSWEAVKFAQQAEETVRPHVSDADYYGRLYALYRQATQYLTPLYHALSSLQE